MDLGNLERIYAAKATLTMVLNTNAQAKCADRILHNVVQKIRAQIP